MDEQKVIDLSKTIISEITKNDLPKVAKVHINAFPESALTKLGENSVQRYYLWQLIGPHKKVRATGVFMDKNCAGFSFSGEFDGSISGFIDHNKTFLMKEVLFHPWLFFNPLFRKRLYSGVKSLKRFYKKKNTVKNSSDKIKPKSFGILSIAVSNDYQKLGIGKILMLDAEEEAVKCGYQRMHLTVSPDNKKAIKFYENLNWQKLSQDNKWNGSMIKMLE